MTDIDGFLAKPETSSGGRVYTGRATLEDVQWTRNGNRHLATFTLSASELTDRILSNLIWTDQGVQRGIRPTAPASTPRELSVAAGYPDTDLYIFNADNADNMVDKLLAGKDMFLNPLVWNLRPGTFKAYSDTGERSIYLYDGRVYLPDSHHRHQAIWKAVRAYREAPNAYRAFDPSMQFKVEVYFLDREDEGNYFFDKNQRPTPTALSKAYDLTTEDDLSVLAKRVISQSQNLGFGVNRVTDRISLNAPHFITLSTLREMMKTFANAEEVEEASMDGLAIVAADFMDLLSEIRPELRAGVGNKRSDTLAAAQVILQGLAAVMRDYRLEVAQLGLASAHDKWLKRLSVLAPAHTAQVGAWSGDFFSLDNPVWTQSGIRKVHPDTGKATISNSGGTRVQAARILRRFIALDGATSSLDELTAP